MDKRYKHKRKVERGEQRKERITGKIRKVLLVPFLVIGAIVILTAAVKHALDDEEFGTADRAMKNSISETSMIYEENCAFSGNYTAEEMQQAGKKLDFTVGDVKTELQTAENVVLHLIELYEERDYEEIYSYIDVAYLNEKGYYIYKESYQYFHEEEMDDYGDYHMVITSCRKLRGNNYLVQGIYQNAIELSNGERGYKDTDKAFSFTIRLKEDGNNKYLPFAEEDLFIIDDYGVTKIKFE